MRRRDWQELIPHSRAKCPQTLDPTKIIQNLSKEIGFSSVIDLGCGHGRLSEAFSPEQYLGLDIDTKVVDIAKARFSNYQFDLVGDEPRFADIYVAYSLFSFLTESQAHNALKKVRCKWLIIGEDFNRGWRSGKITRVHSRELDDYVRIFRSHDFVLHKRVHEPYERIVNHPQLKNASDGVSFLVFKKCQKNPLV